MTGRLIAVVGPSGVGKDSVIDALVFICPEIERARRVITRPDATGEDYEAVTQQAFDRRARSGGFALHWRAHGLSYGIPVTCLARVRAGRDVVVNLSRRVLPQAAALAPSLVVVALSAAPEVLAARLAERGREDAASIAARLDRTVALPDLPASARVIEISNDGPIAETAARVRAALYPDRGARAT